MRTVFCVTSALSTLGAAPWTLLSLPRFLGACGEPGARNAEPELAQDQGRRASWPELQERTIADALRATFLADRAGCYLRPGRLQPGLP